MKVTSLLITAIVTFVSVESAANANAAPEALVHVNYFKHTCHQAGEGCFKARREAVAQKYHTCHQVGEGCFNAKRDASAQKYHTCHQVGEGCFHAKREALAAAEAFASAEALVHVDYFKHTCHEAGEGCFKLKRADEAAAEAMSETDSVADSTKLACYGAGQPCAVAKRSALELAAAVADATASANHHHQCYQPGEGCFVAKRDALEAAEALVEADATANPYPQPGQSTSFLPTLIAHANLRLTDAKAIIDLCNSEGEACHKLRRAVETIAADLDAPDAHFEDGEPDSLHKRAFASLMGIVDSML